MNHDSHNTLTGPSASTKKYRTTHPPLGLESLEPRLLLSASHVVGDMVTPVTSSRDAVVASDSALYTSYEEQTQYDNFFKPNVVVFDFPIAPDAFNGHLDITALSDLNGTMETVAYDIEGLVTGTLWAGPDDGMRPFTATVNLSDSDLAAIAVDGNLHVEFTPSNKVDDFANVSEYVTVGLSYDNLPPRITESSIRPGDIMPAEDLTITVRFNEPVLSPQLLLGEHTRLSNLNISDIAESFIGYNHATNELTVTYDGVPEGTYAFTIDGATSGGAFLTDLGGLILDGERHFTTVPSGDGFEGGVFYVNLHVEDNTPQPLTPTTTTIGSQADFTYEASFSDLPQFLGDIERFTFDLSAGQHISISVDSFPGLTQVELELYDPTGALIASSNNWPAQIESFQVLSTGTYTLLARCTRFDYNPIYSRTYTPRIRVNVVQENESADGWINDTPTTAQDLNAFLFPLGHGVEQAVIQGQLPYDPYHDSFESGYLAPNWQKNIVGNSANSRIEITDLFGGSDGSHALVMATSYFGNGYVLNEAIWTVDLSGFTDVDLSFSHKKYLDVNDPLPDSFVGSNNGDGVAISADGVNWHTILNAPDTPSRTWVDYQFDLVSAATDAGITLGPDFKIKFQQYGNSPITSGGRLFDNIRIATTPTPAQAHDVYRIDLLAGQELSAKLNHTNAYPITLELLDPTGQPVAAGDIDGWIDTTALIQRFVAPADGTYYLRVTGFWEPYTLTVTRGATLVPEPATDTPVPLGPTGIAVTEFLAASQHDRFTFNASAGDDLVISTATPGFGSLVPPTGLDTHLQLFGPDGLLKAEGSTGGEGKNARIEFTADLTGTYTIQVRANNPLPTDSGYLLMTDISSPLPGDLNGDGYVGIEDLSIVTDHWNTSVTPGSLSQGDPSGDGFVGIQDLNLITSNWNAGTAPSQPVAATLDETFAYATAGHATTHHSSFQRHQNRSHFNVDHIRSDQTVAFTWSQSLANLHQARQALTENAYIPPAMVHHHDTTEPNILDLWE